MFAIPRQKSDGSSFQDVIDRLDSQAGATNTWAGATVTERTAMQQITVYACVRLLAETIAPLPIKTQTQQRHENGARVWVDSDHDVLGVLARPNDWQTQHDLLSFWVSWMELRGNGYAFKAYDSKGNLRLLYPLQGTGVDVEQQRDWSLVYSVSEDNGFTGQFSPREVFHLRNFGTDGYKGISTIGNLRNDIGLAQRAKEHGARVFMNGATAGRWIHAPAIKSAENALEFQKQFDQRYSGAERSGKTPVMFAGAELKEIGMSVEDAQLLETLRFQKQELAAVFGVPLFLLNDTEKSTTWGTGLEQITKSFMRFSLRPRLNRLTSSWCRDFLGRNEQRRTRFVFETDAFTMGSFKEVMEAAEKAIASGVMNPNEVREIVNRNPRDGGDVYRESPNSVPEGTNQDTPEVTEE